MVLHGKGTKEIRLIKKGLISIKPLENVIGQKIRKYTVVFKQKQPFLDFSSKCSSSHNFS